jgi:hypothetical protein
MYVYDQRSYVLVSISVTKLTLYERSVHNIILILNIRSRVTGDRIE